MAKTYFSNKTRAQHTYTFFKDRRDDPEWHDEFVRIRRIRRREKLVQTAFGLIIVLVLFVAWHGYKVVTSKNNLIPASSKLSSSSSSISNSDDSSEEKSSTESSTDTTDESSSESSSSKVSSSSQDVGDSEVGSQLAGKRFTIIPIKYDGMDITKVMDDGKAPQNTFHDTHLEGAFVSDKEVRITYSMGATNVTDRYHLTDNMIIIGAYRVPYVLNKGIVAVPIWEENIGNGHTMTMQMTLE